jgi:hypothetical protein
MTARLDELGTPASAQGSARLNLAMMLRRYGFLGCDCERQGQSVNGSFQVLFGPERDVAANDSLAVHLVETPEDGAALGIDCQPEPALQPVYDKKRSRWFFWRRPCYYPVCRHVSFSGRNIIPIWQTPNGRSVLAWLQNGSRRSLLVGFRFVEELARYTQGDRNRVAHCKEKAAWGYPHERPIYLYDEQLPPRLATEPWADHLGFKVAELLSQETGLPLIEPLPGGACGAVLLTGDDDQAPLHKYAEQMRVVGSFPITYLLLPNTHHTRMTLAELPASVQLGLHVDALEQPDQYDAICARQADEVRKLSNRPIQSVRNHGHLNRGYWEHLPAWERSGLALDLNVPGKDATIRTGSFLPFRVMNADGSWSSHYSLLSAFCDSMLYYLKMPARQQQKLILEKAEQIQHGHPGILVFNFHPENIADTLGVHETAMEVGRRPGWIALGAATLVDWLQRLEGLRMRHANGSLMLEAETLIDDLMVRVPTSSGWINQRANVLHATRRLQVA